jgi:hypothetical protein
MIIRISERRKRHVHLRTSNNLIYYYILLHIMRNRRSVFAWDYELDAMVRKIERVDKKALKKANKAIGMKVF